MGVALVATIVFVVKSGHDKAGGDSTPGIVLLFVAVVVGGAIGLWRARIVRMTGMPELIALLHSFVGMAAVLLGWVGHREGLLAAGPAESPVSLWNIHNAEIAIGVFIGAVTFTGS